LVAAGVSPAIVAFAGAFVPILGGGDSARYWAFWAHWYVANALAFLTLGPIFLTWFGAADSRLALRLDWRSAEAVAVGLALFAACVATFSSLTAAHIAFFPALLYLPLPLVLWMTFRFGAKGASAAILIVTVVLVSHALRGPRPFNGDDVENNVLALQLFLTGLSVPIILLGAVIDQLRSMEATARRLTGSVLKAQDEERRRIARELHDSTGQNLVAATLLLGKLQRKSPQTQDTDVSELGDLLQRSIADLRTMSYLLHPPLLDEAGLPLALQSYVNGFSRRSGINVEVELHEDIDRLPGDVELVLFRVMQEALTNISRHTDSQTARIQLRREKDARENSIVLTIQNDNGNGAGLSENSRLTPRPKLDPLRGVGLASMRERLHQVGGRLEFLSVGPTTLVRAVVPLASV
jgi:signal transduction histidine kinase